MLNLTQQQVSELLEISQSNYSKIELQKVVISGNGLARLYECGWDIDYIMTGKQRFPLKRTIQQELRINEEHNQPLYTLFCWAVRNCTRENTLLYNARYELELLQILNELPKEETVLYCGRKMLNLSQEEMAERLLICVKNYREMERGTRKPDGHLLFDIMRLTKYRPSLFISQEHIPWRIMNYILSTMEEGTRKEIIRFIKSGMNLLKKKDRKDGN